MERSSVKTYGYLIAIEAKDGCDPYTNEIWDAIQDVPWKSENKIQVVGVERLGEIDVYSENGEKENE